MAKRFETELSLPVHQREDTQTLLGMLVQAETEYRNTRRTERYLKASKLRYNALPEHIECSVERGITRDQFIGLLDGSYIDAGGNVLISGATGVGKSYIACALGRNACLLGYRTLYFRMNKFLELLSQVRVEGTYIKWLKQINRHQLLIFDDFGLKPLTHDARLTILDILEDRYAGAATIFTSQLPVQKWHEYIDEPTLADAIVDRLTASAHRLELRGKSWRNRKKN
jgi:DNA replication protein DnaC